MRQASIVRSQILSPVAKKDTTRKRARAASATRSKRQPQIPTAETQEKILEAYLPLVRQVAERIYHRLPPGVDLNCLIHSGVVGLLEAAQRYDLNRGATFRTYARYRIQGEIIEYLRSLDWVSRSVRAWGRKVTTARTRLEGLLGHAAAPQELAKELNVSLEEYFHVEQKVNEATLLSLEDLTVASDGNWENTQTGFSHSPFQDPSAVLEKKDLEEKLATALDTIPERERLVMTLYYHEELTLKEIGAILRLTEGRVCQIHAQAASRLRQVLQEECPTPRPAIPQDTAIAYH